MAGGFLIILSLFASTLAACCCSHHQEKAELIVPSCHQQQSERSTEIDEKTNSFDIPCGCSMESAPKVFAKSENIKIEKQAATIASFVSIKFDLTETKVPVANFNFAKPFYLSDSFYRQKSPRAPPIV